MNDVTRRVGESGRECGTMILELVLLTPAFLALLLLVVACGRLSHTRELVDQAAASAARAASLADTPATAQLWGRQAADATLASAGIGCRSMRTSLNVSGYYAGGQVTATVACTADLSDLALPGLPGSKTFRASAVSVIEPYRQVGD